MSANTSTSYPAAMYPGFPAFGMLHHHHTSAQQLLAANHQAAAAAFMAAQLPMSSFASTLFPHHPATLFGAWTANTPPSSHSPPASPDSTLVDVTATTPAPSPALGSYTFGTIQHDNKKARTILTPCGPISPPTSSGSSPTNSSTNDSTDESCGGGSSKDPSRTFTCKICSRSFGYKHVLQNHERTHTGEKPFECPECHKRFTRDHHLKTHMRLHTGEKPYHCQHCDRQFVQVANLRRHLRVHTGERPFTCEICDGKFSDTNQLKSHMLVHNNNEKPLACDHCPMKFRRRHHLLSHKCGGPLTPAISPVTSYVDVQMCDQKSSYGSEDSFDHAKLPPPPPSHYAINMLATSSASSEAPLDLSEDCSSSSGGIEGGRSRKPHDIRRVFRLPPQITHIRCEMPMQTEPEDLSMHTPRYCVDSSQSMMMQHDDIDIDELDDAAALYMRQQQLGALRQSMYME